MGGSELFIGTGSGAVTIYRCSTRRSEFFLLPRHGRNGDLPPHRIDFLANLSALKKLGVRRILATGAVGSMTKKFKVGEVGLLDQFIDLSKRHVTAFGDGRVHVDMTHPYDPQLGQTIISAAEEMGIALRTGLVYVSVDGPRYETAAEIEAFKLLGGDVVGMTGAPEAIISNELGIRYASLVVATNWGAGIQEKVSHEEVVATMASVAPRVAELIERSIDES